MRIAALQNLAPDRAILTGFLGIGLVAVLDAAVGFEISLSRLATVNATKPFFSTSIAGVAIRPAWILHGGCR
jgi:hypothetical protein